MKPKPARLDQIQRWMHSVITHPGGVSEGLDSPQAREHLDVPADQLESVIQPSRAMDSAARLEIYVNAYYERLLECLREEFACTRHATGDDLFDALAFGYLQHHPSRSYTLNLLGADFPRFLAESRLHAGDMPTGAAEHWPHFIIELATFERLQRDVFDGPGSEGQAVLDGARLSSVTADAWASRRFVAAPCLRLHAFEHPVHAYWIAWKQDASPAVPAPRRTCLAIHRRDYAVERHELTAPQFALLASLVRGSSLGDAIVAAASAPDVDMTSLADDLRDWFAAWTRRGYFLDLARPTPSDAPTLR